MSFSSVFVRRPIATTLLTLGVALAGIVAFNSLPVSPLPQVDFPTISVRAQMPGASPQVMASTVATPLERHLGQIADVTEMTSSSSVGSARITLQFGLDRDIDGAARDVQAAINAARADLPTSLRSNPTYRKVNPADAPIMILALTSTTLTRGQIYDAADTVIQEKLSQITGVGEVDVSGSSLPAVRVELNPQALANYGIALEDVRAALSSANAHAPKGAIEEDGKNYQIYTNDQASKAQEYQSLIVAYRNGAAVRLSDVAEVNDSVENLRNFGLANGDPAVLVLVTRSPGANIISTIDSILEVLPQLEASIPSDIKVTVVTDRSTTIRASLHDVERTLTIAVVLVIVVVFLFLRDPRAGLIPTVAVPVSLLGTIGVMWLLGLQPRQSLADGADDLDRLRRRRCDRRAGEHHAPCRSRHVADASDLARRARGRLHRAVDERLARRRLYPDPADGRHHRPAVPRIRDHVVGRDPCFAGRLADDDADDVRALPA